MSVYCTQKCPSLLESLCFVCKLCDFTSFVKNVLICLFVCLFVCLSVLRLMLTYVALAGLKLTVSTGWS